MSYIIVDSKSGSDEMRDKMREKMMQHGFRRMGGHRDSDYRMGNYKEDKYEEGYCEGYKHGFEDASREMSGGMSDMHESSSRYGRY
jgi:hypothetical protein